MKYFIVENGAQQGPFSLYELKDRGVTLDTLVWTEGLADWTPARQVDELERFLSGANVPPSIPQSPQRDNREGPQGHAVPSSRGRGGCLKSLGLSVLVIGIVLVIALAASCPSKQQHKRVLAERLIAAVEKTAHKHENSIQGLGIQAVRTLLNEQLIDNALEGMLDFHNYYVFSKCTILLQRQDKPVSYGILGKVYTINEDDMERFIDNASLFSDADVFEKEANGNATIGGHVLRSTGISAIGFLEKMVKKQIGEHADSTLVEPYEKILDGVADLLIQQLQNK